MRVTVASRALRAGDEIVVSSSDGGEWTATWRGESGVDVGACVDVEVEISNPLSRWDVGRAGHGAAGVATSRGQVTVRGVVTATADDGVVVLDLSPGLVMVELADARRPPEVGALIEFSTTTIELFPTET
ncbi:hypothetical protein [Rhodococcus sp. Q]|uniref:hypothetical protein n=1 Tax=Rhodococcus sp. Q TaxID=2502252 RepID=UPI0010F5BD58|nr:hypothetical protein [Rhodococcus sp. Q]